MKKKPASPKKASPSKKVLPKKSTPQPKAKKTTKPKGPKVPPKTKTQPPTKASVKPTPTKTSTPFLDSQRRLLTEMLSRLTGQQPRHNQKNQDVADEIDQAQELQETETILANMSRNRNTVLEVQHALRKIEEGTYGICEISQEKIPAERLKVMPHARFTVKCTEELERTRSRVPEIPDLGSLFSNGASAETDEDEVALAD